MQASVIYSAKHRPHVVQVIGMSGVATALHSESTPRVDNNAQHLRHFCGVGRLYTASRMNLELFRTPDCEVVGVGIV
jgi:hypothetical protein